MAGLLLLLGMLKMQRLLLMLVLLLQEMGGLP